MYLPTSKLVAFPLSTLKLRIFSFKKKQQFTAHSALRLHCSPLQAFFVRPQRPELFLLCTTVRFSNHAVFDLPAGENQKGVASLPQLTSAARAFFPRQEYISGYPIHDRNWPHLFTEARGPFLSHSFILCRDSEIPICFCVLIGLDDRAIVFRGRRLR